MRLLAEMAFELEENSALEHTEMVVKYVVVVTWRMRRKNKDRGICQILTFRFCFSLSTVELQLISFKWILIKTCET